MGRACGKGRDQHRSPRLTLIEVAQVRTQCATLSWLGELMTACCLSTPCDWETRRPSGGLLEGDQGGDPQGSPTSTHPAQVTPHQAARRH